MLINFTYLGHINLWCEFAIYSVFVCLFLLVIVLSNNFEGQGNENLCAGQNLQKKINQIIIVASFFLLKKVVQAYNFLRVEYVHCVNRLTSLQLYEISKTRLLASSL